MGPLSSTAHVGEVIIAVDGGGSKTDVVALSRDGALIDRAIGAGSSPHFIGVEASVRQIDDLVRRVAGGRSVDAANVYLSGLDFASEIDAFTSAIGHLEWVGASTVVDNDLYALLRSGTSEKDAVAVVCGTGINAIGRRADGEVARFAAVGLISGDWGGATGLGESALWHAARHEDLRGPSTSLTAAVHDTFHVGSIAEVTAGLHLGTLSWSALATLAPLVFAHADAGDPIAGQLVDRQGLEIALMATSCIRRLELDGAAVPVVLGGGVIAPRHPRLMATIETELAARAPLARIHHVSSAPIVGAALLALEKVGATASALDRARKELE